MLTTLVYRFGPPGSARPATPPRTMANGQCTVFRREALLAAGGFAAGGLPPHRRRRAGPPPRRPRLARGLPRRHPGHRRADARQPGRHLAGLGTVAADARRHLPRSSGRRPGRRAAGPGAAAWPASSPAGPTCWTCACSCCGSGPWRVSGAPTGARVPASGCRRSPTCPSPARLVQGAVRPERTWRGRVLPTGRRPRARAIASFHLVRERPWRGPLAPGAPGTRPARAPPRAAVSASSGSWAPAGGRPPACRWTRGGRRCSRCGTTRRPSTTFLAAPRDRPPLAIGARRSTPCGSGPCRGTAPGAASRSSTGSRRGGRTVRWRCSPGPTCGCAGGSRSWAPGRRSATRCSRRPACWRWSAWARRRSAGRRRSASGPRLAHLEAFAAGHPAHRRVVERTRAERWYGEELFARFEPFELRGHVGRARPAGRLQAVRVSGSRSVRAARRAARAGTTGRSMP